MRRSAHWVIVAAAFFIGCDSAKPEDDLTPAQAITILREIIELGVWYDDGDEEVPCPVGGGAWVTVTTSEEQRGDTALFSTHAVLAPYDCWIVAIGDTLILNGDPEVVFEAEAWYIGLFGGIEFELTVAGAVTWTRDGDRKNCGIDMVLEDTEVEPNLGIVNGYMRGTMCGREMVIDYSELS